MTPRPFVSRARNGFWRVFYSKHRLGIHSDYYTTQNAAMTAAQNLAAKGAAWH